MDSYYSYNYDNVQGSFESICSPQSHRIFTPPVTKPKNNVFFNSDDSLFKSERRKFTIPRIEIESDEPVFNLHVTDFSDPAPKNVTLTYDETGKGLQAEKFEEFCVKPSTKTKKDNFAQHKSYSIEVNESSYSIDDINDTDKFLSIGARRCRQHGLMSSSLQDLSSSTSSINSVIHESNLDLSQMDPDSPLRQKNWKSPYEIRYRNVKDLAKKFEDKATSVPSLTRQRYVTNRSKSVSEDKLNDKLTEYERLEILKLLYDWSLVGSESKSECNIKLSCEGEQEKSVLKKERIKFNSEPDLSPKSKVDGLIVITKFLSDNSLNTSSNLDQFSHNCEYRNCIFNVGTKEKDSKADDVTKTKPKSILKPSKDATEELECLNNITNLQKKLKYRRRHSEIIDTKPFDSQLVRCDSLERLNDLQKRHHKKFPDSYIVTRRNSVRKFIQKSNHENVGSPKVVVFRKKYFPKTWKSCSDIKTRKSVRKCCRYAKKSCPVLKKCADSPKSSRKTKSCACIRQTDEPDNAARLGALKDYLLGAAANRPRRMSERDLPSKVDLEHSIPSSKSVPALHQIPGANEHATRPNHDAYSRTSSNNSINNGQQMVNGGPAVSNAALRSRSTHNLHQQDGGFYQNLSIYRNKIPSPQQLGDRTSALRSSQNSLHSSVANSQRPSSAYYPPPTSATPRPNNLHQSIPNLKSPPSTHRLHNSDESGRTSSFPNVQYGQSYYPHQMKNSYVNPEEASKVPYGGSHHSPTHNTYPNNIQQPIHVNPNLRLDDRGQDIRYNNGGGLLREDVFRQSQTSRHDEMMRYPSQGNIRISEAQIQQNEMSRYNEMRTSKSEDLLKHHTQQQNDMMRYASSGNIREGNKVDVQQLRQNPDHLSHHRLGNEDRHQRGVAKITEMSEEVRRRQNRVPYNQQQGQYMQQQQHYYNHMMSQNAQSMQNLSINHQHPQYTGQQHQHQQYQQQQQPNHIQPLSPTYKNAPLTVKSSRKEELIPEVPPNNTHPLYSASSQDPPKMAFYPTAGSQSSKPPRDPWAREEQERQQEARREAARQWQEQQIRELTSMAYRSPQQEEQLSVLQLEREFQRRAMEASAEEGDDDTEKESPSPQQHPPAPQPVSSQTVVSTLTATTVTSKQEPSQIPPTSILKPNVNGNNVNQHHQLQQQQQQHLQQYQGQPSPEVLNAPPPPERGSSFTVMSMRTKETTKRVSFNDVSAGAGISTPSQPPNTLQIEETIREDPNSFIRQAESLLASPTTPTDSSPGILTVTPGVIGAQEVYRDPRTRRLAEQAQRKDQTQSAAVPEKLSFKEKMKMFAMETGEQETPKDKSKISRAQRDIDNLSSPNMVVH